MGLEIGLLTLPVFLSLDSSSLTQVFIILIASAVAALAWTALTNASSSASNRFSNVPELPGAKPVIGHAFEVLTNLPRIHHWLLDNTRAMGHKTYSFRVPTLPTFYMVTDPASLEYVLKTKNDRFIKGQLFVKNFEPILGHGIFTSDGEQWLWQRKLATNIFSVKSFKQYISVVFAEKMQQLTSIIFTAATTSTPLDLHDLMYRFTLDSFGQIGFGVDPACMASKAGKVPFAVAFDRAQVILNARFWVPAWPLVELFNGNKFAITRDSALVKRFARSIINTRREQLAKAAKHTGPSAGADADGDDSCCLPQDLLSLFMDAKGPDGKLLNDKQLVDTVLNFIIAGRDTTAQALSWTFYELMRHPEVEQKVVAEVQQVLGKPPQDSSGSAVKPSYDQIRQLRYTRACFLEALRLHPSVPEDVRLASERDILPDGSVIPKGSQVVYSAYVVNRMTSFWGPDADDFRPERWLEMETMPTPYHHLTFNAGPRLCLGQRLAELEGVYVLAGLLARFSFRQVVPGAQVHYVVASTLPMQGGLQVLVEQRD